MHAVNYYVNQHVVNGMGFFLTAANKNMLHSDWLQLWDNEWHENLYQDSTVDLPMPSKLKPKA